uniref:Acetolactate synthase small subunit n=1 Tax=Thermosporothrix sp. COM3 TaxID=2490863 RepID=A0A455SNW7_9CHLR|nr:acetolactate synthase small subunit [Thermosporothrix sp. COM3]
MKDTSVMERAGHSVINPDAAQTYTLMTVAGDRPGTVDRIINILRRRRANMQTMTIARDAQADQIRVTITVNDTEVGKAYLIEQLRKIVDVQSVEEISATQAVSRELALVNVASTAETTRDILEVGNLFGAHTVDITPDSIVLEITGSSDKVSACIEQLQPFGIREIARSGQVTLARESEAE